MSILSGIESCDTNNVIIDIKHVLTFEFYLNLCSYIMYSTSGSRGGAPGAPPPPNGRVPMIFYAQNAKFSQIFFRSLRSRSIISIILIEIGPKQAKI